MIICAVSRGIAAGLDPQACLCASELQWHGALDADARRDFLAGRVALKDALRRQLGRPDADVRTLCVDNAADGRPLLTRAPQLHCSLAHSDGWGIGAVSTASVGVDIERLRPRSPSLLRYIADDVERELVAAAFPRDEELIAAVWTIKEAALKAIGAGLAVAPRRARITNGNGSTFLVEDADRQVWSVETRGFEEVRVSIATRAEDVERVCIHWYQPAGVPHPVAEAHARGA